MIIEHMLTRQIGTPALVGRKPEGEQSTWAPGILAKPCSLILLVHHPFVINGQWSIV